MLFCLNCVKRSNCKEICKEVEALLPKPTTGRLRGEHSFDPDYLETTAAKRAFKIKFGVRKLPNHLQGD